MTKNEQTPVGDPKEYFVIELHKAGFTYKNLPVQAKQAIDLLFESDLFPYTEQGLKNISEFVNSFPEEAKNGGNYIDRNRFMVITPFSQAGELKQENFEMLMQHIKGTLEDDKSKALIKGTVIGVAAGVFRGERARENLRAFKKAIKECFNPKAITDLMEQFRGAGIFDSDNVYLQESFERFISSVPKLEECFGMLSGKVINKEAEIALGKIKPLN